MSQFNAPGRRSSASADVYTGLLFAAMLVLAAGVAFMMIKNIDHSSTPDRDDGGPFKVVSSR